MRIGNARGSPRELETASTGSSEHRRARTPGKIIYAQGSADVVNRELDGRLSGHGCTCRALIH